MLLAQHTKTENILSKEGQSCYILVKNRQVSLYRFLTNRGGCIGGIESTTACYEEYHAI